MRLCMAAALSVFALSCTDLGGLSGDDGGSGGGGSSTTTLAGDGDFTSVSGSCGPDWRALGSTSLAAVEPGREGGKACRVCNSSSQDVTENYMASTRLEDIAQFRGKRLFGTAWVKLPDTGIARAELQIKTIGAGRIQMTPSGLLKSPSSGWQPLQVTFEVPADAESLAFMFHIQANANACADVDGLSLTEVP